MKRTTAANIFAAAAIGLLFHLATTATAQDSTFTKNGTVYVRGYQVQGNMAVPVTGVLENSMIYWPNTPQLTVQPPVRLTERERMEVQRFLAEVLPRPQPPIRR